MSVFIQRNVLVETDLVSFPNGLYMMPLISIKLDPLASSSFWMNTIL